MNNIIQFEKYYKPPEEIIQMENKRIKLSLGKTINVGNYESIRVDLDLSGEIGDSEFADAIEDLSDECHELLKHEIEVAITKHHEG